MIFLKEQKNYIDKIKEILEEKNEIQKYYIETFGCTLNENDSEKIAGMLESSGYKLADNKEEANIIVFNTCCIRENAEEKLFGKLGEVKQFAKNGCIVAIGGCMMQEKEMVEKVKTSFSFVKLIFGTHTLYRLPENLFNVLSENTLKSKTKIDVMDIDGEIYEGLPIKRLDKYRAYVTIMYGCNNFCTYCIVPYVRGRERSRKPEDILNEVKNLVKEGYKEITLLGQNVNSYVGDNNIKDFADLVQTIAEIKELKQIRFISPHPKDFSDKLIDVIAKNTNIARNLHFPLQSGSTKILAKMNRKYTKDEYILKAEKIKNMIPDVALSTDIIVGFPGETEEDFEDTLDVVKKVGFDQIFMFIYSPRKGTPGYNMTSEFVKYEVAVDRLERLKKVYESEIDKMNDKYIGKEEYVIIEGESKNNEEMLSARTDSNKVVIFKKFNNWQKGMYIKIKIISNHRWYLLAEVIQE